MMVKNIIRRGILVVGMLVCSMGMQAQNVSDDTIKVIYPGDSSVVKVPNSQEKYVEERAILTPDDKDVLLPLCVRIALVL